MSEDLDVEGRPSDSQKERLEDFLAELMLITRKYGVLLHDRTETVELLDMPTGNLIGLGLTAFTPAHDDHRILGYVPTDSVLDGVWLMDDVDGPVEQRHVQNVAPLREGPA